MRARGEHYRRTHTLTPEQHRTLDAIERCRTAALGGHLDVCSSCGDTRPSYNSCRNRHCPKCQGLAQLKWLEGRKLRILPTHYFHVVFTLPSQLRRLAKANPRKVYGLMFKAAAQTLLELGRDTKRLGRIWGSPACCTRGVGRWPITRTCTASSPVGGCLRSTIGGSLPRASTCSR